MSVTIVMDPGAMLKSAGSLRDAAAQTRGSARALGALSSPPPGVPASVAGRVTGATNRAKGALERQADLIESFAADVTRRAHLAYAADVAVQITSLTNKVAGLAVGVGQAGVRYDDRQRMTHALRRKGMAPSRIRDKVDVEMAKKHGVTALSPGRQADLERRFGSMKGPDGGDLPRRGRVAAGSIARAPLGGAGPGAPRGAGDFLKKSPNGPLSLVTTGVTHAGTVANPNLSPVQKRRQIAADSASAAVGATPAIAATAAFGGPVGLGVAGVMVAGDVVSGGKVSEATATAGGHVVRGVERVPGRVKDDLDSVHRGIDSITPWDGVAPW